MKVKVWVVEPKDKKANADTQYFVDAPSKRIAAWCGANLYNVEYVAFLRATDMRVRRFNLK